VSFLAPWFLLGALAVAAPIIVHLRRKEVAPSHEFSAVRFLRRAPYEQQHPRHLHDLLLLLLRAGALILLVLAFARPYIVGGDGSVAKTTMIAVDTSFSMGAPGRFDRAREAAQKAVAAAPSGYRVGVVRFDDHATLVVQPTLDRGAARAAIASFAPGAGATEYAAALSTSSRAIGPDGGQLVIVTDLLGGRGWGPGPGSLPDNVELSVRDVGGSLENLSVGRLTLNGDSIVAQVVNHGVRPRKAPVSLWLNDRSVAEASAEIQPGATAAVQLLARFPSSGVVRVSVADAEGPPADNERFLVLDPPPAPAVLLMAEAPKGEDLFYLRTAVESADAPRRLALEALSGDARNAITATTARERQVIGLLGTRGLERPTRAALAQYVNEGGSLLLVATAALDAGTLDEIVGERGLLQMQTGQGASLPTALAPVDRRHPIFAAFGDATANLGDAEFDRVMRVTAGAGSRTIARFTNGLPALVEQPVGKGRIVVFASDLSGDWNSFPRQPSFVPFVLETLRYLSGSAGEQRGQRAERLVADVPPGVAAKPGVVRMGAPPRPVAINVDLRESSTAQISSERFVAAVRRVPVEARTAEAHARERESSQHLWRIALAVMGIFLITEGLFGHRLAGRAVARGTASASSSGA
jgi:hypothetical protein